MERDRVSKTKDTKLQYTGVHVTERNMAGYLEEKPLLARTQQWAGSCVWSAGLHTSQEGFWPLVVSWLLLSNLKLQVPVFYIKKLILNVSHTVFFIFTYSFVIPVVCFASLKYWKTHPWTILCILGELRGSRLGFYGSFCTLSSKTAPKRSVCIAAWCAGLWGWCFSVHSQRFSSCRHGGSSCCQRFAFWTPAGFSWACSWPH